MICYAAQRSGSAGGVARPRWAGAGGGGSYIVYRFGRLCIFCYGRLNLITLLEVQACNLASFSLPSFKAAILGEQGWGELGQHGMVNVLLTLVLMLHTIRHRYLQRASTTQS